MKTRIVMSQIWALARRDFLIWGSYRTQVTTSVLGVAFGLVSWAVLGHYTNQAVPEYGTSYISFLIVGILIYNFAVPLSTGLQNRLNPWTIETVFMSGLGRTVFVVGSLLFNFLFSVTTLLPQLLIALLWFGVRLNIDFLSFALAVLTSLVIVVSLAMIDMGVRVVTKQADPILWALIVAQGIVSGMLYPIQTLNNYVPGASTAAFVIPFTWVYHLIRLSVLAGAHLTDPTVALTFLGAIGYCAVLLPFSYGVMKWGISRAKKDGTLGWY
jgi:ABC-type multidrug transport system permease subunit